MSDKNVATEQKTNGAVVNEQVLTAEQLKENQRKALAAEGKTALVDLTDSQIAVMKELGIFDDRENIATSAFASAIRGKMQSSIDKAIKAKYEADSRNKKAVSEELEKEIQRGIKLKRDL